MPAQQLGLAPAAAANPLASPVRPPPNRRRKRKDGRGGPDGVRYGLVNPLDQPSLLTEATRPRRRRGALIATTRDAHKPVFTDLMKAAAVGRQGEVERLLTLPTTLETLFATERGGRNALAWAHTKNFPGCASLIQRAMEREVRVRAEDREAQERIFDLKRIVRTNTNMRAVMEHAINERDVATINRCVEGADFDREEYARACHLLRNFIDRHADETVITDNEEDFDPDPDSYYVDAETPTGGNALLIACAENQVELADKLLTLGAVVDFENVRGHTALSWACICGVDAVVEMLLQHGADPKYQSKLEQRTPLCHGAQHGHAKVCQVLLDRLLFDAQMKRHELLKPGRDLPEQEAYVVERHWMRDFEENVTYLDPGTDMTALELAKSAPNNARCVQVLETAEKRVLQRRQELVALDLGQAPCACPRDCGSGLMRQNTLQYHLLNTCDLRPTGCDNCGGTLPLRYLQQHNEKECPARKRACKLCGVQVLLPQLEAHSNFLCRMRLATCRLGCGAQLPMTQLPKHEVSKCRWRGVPCPICSQEIRAKDLKEHKLNECPRRPVKCRLGCGLEVPFEERERHEQHVCTRPCMWCAELIGPESRRRLHERFHCPRRHVQCPHACPVEGVAAEDMARHCAEDCPLLPSACPNNCAWTGFRKDIKIHIDGESGSCPERLRRCRYNLLQRRVTFRIDNVEQQGVLRKYLGETDAYYVMGDPPRTFRLCEVEGFQIVDGHTYTCGHVKARDMAQHMTECPVKPFAGRVLPDSESDDGSVASVSAISDDAVPEGRAQRFSLSSVDDVFAAKQSAPSEGRDILPHEVDPETGVAYGATAKRCKYGCNATFKLNEVGIDLYAWHKERECPKQPVGCAHCGDQTLWAEEVDAHQLTCPVLTYTPPPPGFSCKCGAWVLRSQQIDHAVSCVAKEQYCPGGCGLKMLVSQVEEHMTHKCPKRHLRRGVLVDCKLGCGRDAIPFALEFHHLTTECPRRVVECAPGVEAGCLATFPAAQWDEHAHTCPCRPVLCGAGAEGCVRELRSWVSDDGEKRLVTCDVHGASALLFAVRAEDTLLLHYLIDAVDKDQAQLEAESRDGHTALTKACEQANLEHIEILWRCGVALNKETARGRTALIEAAKNGHGDVCRFLVDRGADIKYRNRFGKSALQWAGLNGNIHVQRQMRRDADVQESMAVLFTHVTRGDLAKVHDVVEAGEVYSPCAILQLGKELLEEDRLLEVAKVSLKASEQELLEYQQKEQQGLSDLTQCSRLAKLVEGLADRTLDARKRLTTNTAEKHRRCALQLPTIESADLAEIMALKSSAVRDRVFRVFLLCCMLLGLELPDGAMPRQPPDLVGDAQKEVDACKDKLETARGMDDAASTFSGDEAKEVTKTKQAACLEAVDALDNALKALEKAEEKETALAEALVTTKSAQQLQQEKKAAGKLRAQTWRACKKLLKMKDLVRKLRFFAEGAAPWEMGLCELLREKYSDPAVAKRSREARGQFDHVGVAPVVEAEALDEAHLPEDQRTQPEDRAAASELKAATKYAADVAARPAFFALDGETGTAVDGLTNAEVEGYHVVGVLALFANAHIASEEAQHAQEWLERTELQLRSRFDDDRAPALLAAKRYAYVAHSRVKMVRDERDQWRKEFSFRTRRVKAWEGKVRAARVLQQYTPGGHSLLTWACTLGMDTIVEELLDHGACPGLPDVVLAEAARVAQLVYRHHRWRATQRRRMELSAYARSAQERAMRGKREAEHCFELQRCLTVYRDKRGAHRVPLCEAAYNGHDGCFEAFKRRKLLRGGAALYETQLYPEPPFPYCRRQCPPGEAQKLYNVDDCAKHGARDLNMQAWRHGRAWIPQMDEEAPRFITLVASSEAWQGHLKAVQDGILSRANKIADRRAKQARKAAIDALEEALRVDDFMRIGQIFDEGVVAVDHEVESTGLTPLIAAAREDTAASRMYCVDDDGRPCLAVQFLLDREKRRPHVDMENSWGNTALTMAVCKGRVDVIDALLDRSADINKKSIGRKGWTPLRFAAERDKPRCIELLLLRGADPAIVADDGRTPLDICVKRGWVASQAAFTNTLRRGFTDAVVRRDTAVPLVCCAYGCGAFIPKESDDPVQWKEHHEDCRKRPVTCEECGVTELWAEELQSHLELFCKVVRPMDCPLGCGLVLREGDLAEHLEGCKNKVTICDGCGVEVFERSYAAHKDFRCPARPKPKKLTHKKAKQVDPEPCELCGAFYRPDKLAPEAHDCIVLRTAPCPNKCGVELRRPDLQDHLLNTCAHHWVLCKRGCGLKVRQADMAIHLDGPGPPGSRCGLVERYCDDCQQPVKLGLWNTHMASTCPRRRVSCPLCSLEVIANELDAHKNSACPIRLVTCPSENCFKELPLNQMKQHATQECKKRDLKCPQGCGSLMSVRRLTRHMSHRCPKRYVVCPLACGAKFRAEEETYHVTRVCVRRHAGGSPAKSYGSYGSPTKSYGSPAKSRAGSPAKGGVGLPAKGGAGLPAKGGAGSPTK